MAKQDELTILVLFYSFTGKTAMLAEAVAAGARIVHGVNVEIKRAPEILADSFFEENEFLAGVKKDLEDKYEEATVEDLVNADGVAFGTPVHFGSFASQLKQFIDQMSPAWLEGKMVNKPASLFCSSGSLHGGEEVTLVSMMIPLLNLGMIPVGIPYPMQGMDAGFDAGSPYGAVYVAKKEHGDKLPEDDERVARYLGQRLATMTQLLSCACNSCGNCQLLTTKQHD